MMTDNPTEKRRCGRIADYLPLVRAADGLTLSQICSLSGLEPSTIQNWIKRGYVPHPVGKKYRERHLARILLISELRESMQIDRVGGLLRYINGDTDDESDDIITEEALYDVFCEMSEHLEACSFSPEKTAECVNRAAASLTQISSDDKERIVRALLIMANVYASGCYKREAEQYYQTYIGT